MGCTLTLHVQDNRIVKVTSPLDHDVTHGHLCIKGRFGFEFVQRRAGESWVRRQLERPRPGSARGEGFRRPAMSFPAGQPSVLSRLP